MFSPDEDESIPMKADKRPDWCLFGKVNQNMETIMFKEKFVDWPDSSRLIKVKDNDDDKKVNFIFDIFFIYLFFLCT